MVLCLAGRNWLSFNLGSANPITNLLRPLSSFFTDNDFFHHPCLLLDHRLFGHFCHFNRLLAQAADIRLRRRPVYGTALDMDMLFAKLNVLFDRLLNDMRVDSYAAALHDTLSDLQVLLNNRNGTFGALVLNPGRVPLISGTRLTGYGVLPGRAYGTLFIRVAVDVDGTARVHDINRALPSVFIFRVHGDNATATPDRFLVSAPISADFLVWTKERT